MRTSIIVISLLLASACSKSEMEKPAEAMKAKTEAMKAKAGEAAHKAKAKAMAGADKVKDMAAKAAKPMMDEAWKTVPELSISELEAAMKSGAVIVDANGPDTREKFGVIPGALKINYREYDPATALPKDKSAKVVFYCGNTKCTAAPKAAAKAMKAGYTNVSHLKVGIKGWVDAGKKVDKG